MAVERGFQSEHLTAGSVGPLVVVSYRGGTKAELEQLDAFQAQLVAKHGRIASMSLMDNVNSMVRMDEETRKFSAELAQKYAKTNIGGAIVVRTRGIGAVIARTSLSAVFLVTQNGVEMKVFKAIDEGLTWLRSLPAPNPLEGLSVTAADIEAFVKL
ncbi:MAG: hypothetical protein GQE15_04165 [Archangiaceae bacterium]|nr:hypothetical protein [Archangiaceae bacterium]